MITDKDLEIQNISYTNKDFGQIYPELIELAKGLTNKWDPEATNESDPGIVLLKLVAFLGDKLNYNIDKNTLEQFMPSATQETSMRRLTEMLGYNMKYYTSATTKISFRYTGKLKSTNGEDDEDTTSESEQTNSLENLNSFVIKAFDTTFKTSDDIIYTLLEDIEISDAIRLATNKLAIQGQLKNLTVLGSDNYTDSTLIQLYNLDDQNRLYFPDIEVAENGIFINKEVYSVIHSDYWHRVDNLNDQDLGSKVFKFGFDSDKGFPYIEFPKDIADLIEDGLQISYIVSSGETGKVLNNKLTSFSSVKVLKETVDDTAYVTSIDEGSYILSNSSSTLGSNPENLTEAYNNFKKTIGTFNTLVSCRDYSNYLNRYEDDQNNKLVSNCCATDVRTDLDYSKKIFTRDKNGSSYYTDIVTSITGRTPYDLIMHGTQPTTKNIQSLSQYNKTYNSLTADDIIDITTAINDVKSINHSVVLPVTLNYVEADYTLKANISTKYKVNTNEQKSILANIKYALYNTFNASKVDFGEEIPYDSIVECIENADTRIKNVNLNDPEIVYNLHNANNTIVKYELKSSNKLSDVIIDNILAGALPVYGEDTSYNLDYLQSNVKEVKNLAGICGSITLVLNAEKDYTLQKNESLQIIQDSYLTDVIYPAYVYYAFITDRVAAGELAINKNTVYSLGENDILYIQYTDSSNVSQFKKYTYKTVIKPNFDIVNTNGLAHITNSDYDIASKDSSKFIRITDGKTWTTRDKSWEDLKNEPNIVPLFALGTNEEIDMLKKNEVKLDKNSNVFWYIKPRLDGNKIINERGDLIFTKNPYEDNYYYILEEGEYFIYPNDDMTSLNILESGTKLTVNFDKNLDSDNTKIIISRSKEDAVDLSELESAIEDNDVGTFKKLFNWENLNRSLKITESLISNYAEGTKLKSAESSLTITNNWSKCPNKLIIDNSELTLYTGSSSTTQPLIRSVLSIYCDKDNEQTVLEGQNIYYVYNTNETTSDEDSTNLTSEDLQMVSLNKGDTIQLSYLTDTYNNCGVLASIKYEKVDNILKPIKDESGNYIHEFLHSLIKYNEITEADEYSLQGLLIYLRANNKINVNDRDEYVISAKDLMNYMSKGMKTMRIYSVLDGCYYNIFNTYTLITELKKGDSQFIDISMYTNASDDVLNSNYLYITKPKLLKLYKYLEKAEIGESTIISYLKSYPQFDWIGKRNESKIINSYDPLYSFFDPNNLYNNITLAKIDFDSSEFNIVGSSKI